MLVFSHHITPRLQYIIDYFNEKSGLDATLISDEAIYRTTATAKINYSHQRITADELHIHPIGLLQEDEIKNQHIACFEWKDTIAFFKTEDDDVGFDIFSAVFYCISRYEEYLEHEPDEYGRYAHWNSLAWKNGFLNKPIVDSWLQEFGKLLQNKFSTLAAHFTQNSSGFTFIPTYDIDIAWSYKHKGFWRSLVAAFRQPSTIAERLSAVLGKKKDPYDSYQWLDEFHQTHQMTPIYFFLVAQEHTAFDKNISPKKKALQQLIQQTKQKYEIGLHPSTQSNTAKECLLKEKNTLQQIMKAPVTKSRHHYLQLHVPHSYRALIAAGITDDYTMGYGTVNGFRAGTSNSYLWYDLENECSTKLRIHPFAFMEANSFYELKQNPDEALQELMQLKSEVEQVNGTLITVFHNHMLGTASMFAGWREMYEQFVRLLTKPA